MPVTMHSVFEAKQHHLLSSCPNESDVLPSTQVQLTKYDLPSLSEWIKYESE